MDFINKNFYKNCYVAIIVISIVSCYYYCSCRISCYYCNDRMNKIFQNPFMLLSKKGRYSAEALSDSALRIAATR